MSEKVTDRMRLKIEQADALGESMVLVHTSDLARLVMLARTAMMRETEDRGAEGVGETMTAYQITEAAQIYGIPHVEVSEPWPCTIDVVADRPRNVHPAVWRSWCFGFTCWLHLNLPVATRLTFRTQRTILPLGWS